MTRDGTQGRGGASRRPGIMGLFALVLGGLLAAASAQALDYPHVEGAGITCGYCHFVFSRFPGLLPAQYQHVAQDLDDTPSNTLCWSCHNDVDAPYVKTHSSLATSARYGNWSIECRVCHNAHLQDQPRTYGAACYVASGTSTAVTSTSLDAAGAGWTPGAFAGFILIPNLSELDYNYKILGNTAESLTLEGPVDQGRVSVGDSFGIIYGKLLRPTIATPNSGERTVRFLGPDGAGSFADGDTVRDGICEVCHTQTTHYRNDGLGSDQDHTNVEPAGLGGDHCVRCHSHQTGFAHGGGSGQGCDSCHGASGAHGPHLSGPGATCSVCHDSANFPFFKSGTDANLDGHIDLAETNDCDACHQDGSGGAPNNTSFKAGWTGGLDLGCDGCHNGRSELDAVEMSSNGHHRLVGSEWIRKYPCSYCHADSVDASWNLLAKHANGTPDVALADRWQIPGKPFTYDPATKTCSNTYCHSDGTLAPRTYSIAWTQTTHLGCNNCHGHPIGDCTECHTGGVPGWTAEDDWKSAMPMYANGGPGTERANTHSRHLMTDFSCENCHAATVVGSCSACHSAGIPPGQMGEVGHVDGAFHVNGQPDIVFAATGTFDESSKTCTTTECHLTTAPQWGDDVRAGVICLGCHGTPEPDVDDYGAFNDTRARINLTQWFDTGHGRTAASGNYKSGNPPANFPGNPCWYCHDPDVLHKDEENPYRLKIHPEYAAHFEKECVFCHMEHKDSECLGCHNSSESLSPQLTTLTSPPFSRDHTGYTDGLTSCLTAGCHPDDASQHKTGSGTWTPAEKGDILLQYQMMGVCLKCHDEDKFNVVCQDPGGGGPVCTDCHSPDPRDRCQQCHTGPQYALGFDPGTGFISGTTSHASTSHFGYKHYQDFADSLTTPDDSGTATAASADGWEVTDTVKSWTPDQWTGYAVRITAGPRTGEMRQVATNIADTVRVRRPFQPPLGVGDSYDLVNPVWKGGKFCWDCHDPHGDGNVFMIHDQVAKETDGVFGIPVERAPVTFTNLQSGLDYVRTGAPYDGLCNVCHTDTNHYTATTGDGHNAGRRCTTCHSHRFGDSHASGKSCNTCHQAKPLTRHEGLGQPRDCTKCHDGIVGLRMDIMGQLRSNSHHIQGVEVTGQQCYQCHWEATPEGLVNVDYHEGFNNKAHTAAPNSKVDLVVMGPGGARPTTPVTGTDPDVFEPGDTVVQFTANRIGTVAERDEVGKITNHCLGCHSDQNNDTDIFGDCKTPRQYAWDRSSIAARYTDLGTAPWGKYPTEPNAAPKALTKAYSAHGNAAANQGGWDPLTGLDAGINSTREGDQNVQCFDCHSSHGSKTAGTTSSYLTFNNTNNGANLKETQAGKGGYSVTYRAKGTSGGINPVGAGAAQCFDCHETETAGALPWGYNSTFGAAEPIEGYKDTSRFGDGVKGSTQRYPYRASRTPLGGHLAATSPLTTSVQGTIGGLCSPCHDPHGVSPSLGALRDYAVPLLKGTWLTSPYKEDLPTTQYGSDAYYRNTGWGPPPTSYHLDQDTFAPGGGITQTETEFAGLCLRCHPKASLTDGTDKNTPWQSVDRIHETVKDWGSNAVHNYSCSKCHQAHVSGLPRLMTMNCLDVGHQGLVASGGEFPPYQGNYRQFSILDTTRGGKPPRRWRGTELPACHESSAAGGGTWNYNTTPPWDPAVQRWNTVTPW